MANICKCDRCGKEITTYYTIDIDAHDTDINKPLVSSEVFGFKCAKLLRDAYTGKKQFCIDCRISIENFINQKGRCIE